MGVGLRLGMRFWDLCMEVRFFGGGGEGEGD